MGKLTNGINGNFIGTAGNVVGYMWRGINCIRTKPQHIRDRKSQRQMAQRQCLSEVLRLMQSMTDYVRIGFSTMPYVYHQSAFNAAMSYNMQNGVQGKNSNLRISYSHIAVSRGDLMNATGVSASLSYGAVTFQWTYDCRILGAKGTDYAMPLIYNKGKRQSLFNTSAVRRSEETLTMELPDSWAGDRLEIYLSFRSADGKHIADSLHIGSFKAVRLSKSKEKEIHPTAEDKGDSDSFNHEEVIHIRGDS